jgi:mRNA interferase MazF
MIALSKIRRGCIYWVDFDPVRGSEQGKMRPALVVQNNLANLASNVTMVVPLSSKIPSKEYPFNVLLPNGFDGTPAVILCQHIRTVSLERVDPRILCELSAELMARVEEAISHQLGFSPETVGM